MISVLIVDDERLVRDTLKAFIPWREIGIDSIYEAENGKKGLAYMEKYHPSIIITDIKMPHMNGMEFAKRIRECPWPTKLVFLSGYTDKEYLKGAIHLHVDGYIEKPVNPQEITALMRSLATQCHKDRGNQDEAAFFFYGDYLPHTLNSRVFRLSKPEILAIGKALKQKDRTRVAGKINALISQMKSCEATSPDYIRNVFSQIALQIESAAGLHGAKQAQEDSERFIYAASSVSQLSALEEAAFRIIDTFFTETQDREIDPITQINDYLHTHYANCGLSIHDIAKSLNFNSTYLCTVYKQKTGRTINAVLTEIRMDAACKLLSETSLKLYAIAEKVGYRDGKYFTKVFAKEVGMLPRHYREQHYGT